ncbi:undecaprenyl-phosphate glucose phosphotransferase [Thiocystis violacea]|uniref:undecaprenyl-phosphate glucose phosphotransferase n=1 Tax=Thiocystis violacea TaxID=13725 RepID=UPI00190532D0|nr:undecaprenyl-phosphate glucose phosphotransferase [Thiocystis violacea]MBK1720494.1 undecaprenyl-phosphate glucose phosphotransferase [Thiocystis violacea]
MQEALSETGHRTAAALPFGDLGCRLNYLLYFADIGFLGLSAILIHLGLRQDEWLNNLIPVALAALLAILAYSFFTFSSGLYDWRQFRHKIKNPTTTFNAVLFAFGVLLLIAFSLKITDNFSRLWTALWLLSVILYLAVSRLTLAIYLARPDQRNLMQRKAIIVGAGDTGQDVLDHLRRFEAQDIRVIGFLDDRASRLPPAQQGVPVLGPTSRLERLLHNGGPDLIILALPRTALARIHGLATKLSTWSVDIYLAPDRLGLDHAHRPVHRLGGMNLLSLRDRPISEWEAVVKRIEDLCIAIPAIVLLSPLLALVALAIRLESKGDVLFVQERFGFNNNLIRVFKFRSMYTHMTDFNAERLTSKDDPRVTRVGRFIRRTSLDELPQLFNVVRGCMSIVGPRPHATRAKAGEILYQDAVAQYASRHRVKPGITGWAQCNGWRGETDTEEKIQKRVEHDLYYIENWSVFLDLLTIARTLLLLFKRQENAF